MAGTVATWDVGLGRGRGARVVSELVVAGTVVLVVVVVVVVGRLRFVVGLVKGTSEGDVVGRREYVTEGVVDSGFGVDCVVAGRLDAMVVCVWEAAIELGGLRDAIVDEVVGCLVFCPETFLVVDGGVVVGASVVVVSGCAGRLLGGRTVEVLLVVGRRVL